MKAFEETSASARALALCLVCDDPVVETAVRVSCPPPNRIDVFARCDLVNAQHTISGHGLAIVRAAAAADAVLVEWTLDEAPIINTLCYHIRRGLLAPVLALCRDSVDMPAAAIAAGADDSLSFPLYVPLVQAKVLAYRRLIRTVRDAPPSAGRAVESEANLRFGALRLDRSAHRFFVDETEVELTPREFGLLDYLVGRPDALCTRDQILSAVWGLEFDTGTNMVDVYMHFLRKKLEAHGLKNMIQTVRGYGYRLVQVAG